jgi:hypothetical protein
MGERPYRCHGCNRGFRDASDRKRHVKTHRGEEEIKNVFDFILNKEYILFEESCSSFIVMSSPNLINLIITLFDFTNQKTEK